MQRGRRPQPRGETNVAEPLPSPEEIAKLAPDGGPEFNRLIHERSPYLLQHARNPVDWYPWGEEAFGRARREDKTVFLSIGYSTCHWCHVMERESFEREDVAALLNQDFVAIKVDREERPDIDEIYMLATQLLTGTGGWPNSLWLTPDGRPWFAGTYFPPEDHPGRPGFMTVLRHLAHFWRTRRDDVEAQADQLADAVRRASSAPPAEGASELNRGLVQEAIRQLRDAFDPRFGGFGGAPKFPPHNALSLLLHEYQRTRDSGLLEVITRTLDAMARGGIRDHVGGGFHRYATDAEWFLPHFEKMLYDNALLSRAYVDAYSLTGSDEYRRAALGTYEWVLQDMTDEAGGFYSALDADSEGQEGRFYVWTRAGILDVLGPDDGDLFCRIYHVEDAGNFADEATGRRHPSNILHLSRPLEQTAKALGVPEEDLTSRLAAARDRLLERRSRRVWPHLDDKVLASWNGLMIGSLAHAGRCLDEPRYTEAAAKAAEWILSTLIRDGRLLHSYRAGAAGGAAYLDDHAFLADGLLDLHEATGEKRWLDEAQALSDVMIQHYADAAHGGFFFTADGHETLLLRSKNAYDSAVPSGNGVAARVLVRLADRTGHERYREAAASALRAFAGLMQTAPAATESLLLATAVYLDSPLAAETVGEPAGAAPESREPDARSAEGPVAVEAYLSPTTVAPGESIRLAVSLHVEPGWHVNSHQPIQPYLLPTTLSTGRNSRFALGPVRYPDGKTISTGLDPEPLSVYDGTAPIETSILVPADAKPGRKSMTIEVRVQPCNDEVCLPPQTHRLRLRFNICARG
jgi:uncharacterized protein YyaL (SSP411 family)